MKSNIKFEADNVRGVGHGRLPFPHTTEHEANSPKASKKFVCFRGMIGFDNRIVFAWCKREFRDSLITRKSRSAKATSGAVASPFQVKDLALAYA